MKLKIFFLLLVVSNLVFSQNNFLVNIEWEKSIQVGEHKALAFRGATYHKNQIPVYTNKLIVNRDAYKVQITDKKFAPFSNKEISCVDGLVK